MYVCMYIMYGVILKRGNAKRCVFSSKRKNCSNRIMYMYKPEWIPSHSGMTVQATVYMPSGWRQWKFAN